MKIVFIKDIPKVGQRGQVKDVAPGYGNSLLFRGLADRATPNVLAVLEVKRKKEEYKKKMKEEILKELFIKTGIEIDTNIIDVGHIKNIGEHAIKFLDKENKEEFKIKIE